MLPMDDNHLYADLGIEEDGYGMMESRSRRLGEKEKTGRDDVIHTPKGSICGNFRVQRSNLARASWLSSDFESFSHLFPWPSPLCEKNIYIFLRIATLLDNKETKKYTKNSNLPSSSSPTPLLN